MNNNKKKKILEGHKREGKRFIPPMMQIPSMKSYSYVNDMLPELIWIGLINDRFGYVQGARIIEKIFLIVDGIIDTGQHGNFALASTFHLLNNEQKQQLLKLLEKEEILDSVRNAIAPLTLLYDEFPLRFIGYPTDTFNNQELVKLIKGVVGKTIDKYETAGIVLHGAMLISRLITRTIHFSKDMSMPDFNAVIDSPNSDEAKHAAGFLRSSALAQFAMLGIDKSWPRYFWNRSYELNPCEFYEVSDD